MKKYLFSVLAVIMCTVFTGCKSNAPRPVNGTMEEAVENAASPEAVITAMKSVSQIDDRFETVMEDKNSGVSVWSLLKVSDEVSSEGYGMVVAKGDVKTALPQILHGRMPRARFDASTGDLLILGSDTEGTNVNVERPYLLRFGDDGHASIVTSIDPYKMQQALCEKLTYSIEGKDITFYAEGKPLTTVKSTIEDMGDIMDDAIYIGEQISYAIEGPLRVIFTPGVNFTVGKVLQYDDMPDITATVTLNEDGSFTLSNFEIQK